MIPLSFCMIVKDELVNLQELLPWLLQTQAELVIVDTGSTDGTLEYLQENLQNVPQFNWCDDFAAARNFSIAQASREYICWLDADDRMDDMSLQKLTKLVQSQPQAAYQLRVRSPIEMNSQGEVIQEEVFTQLRLFPRVYPGVHPQVSPLFRSPIHEEVRSHIEQNHLQVLTTDIEIQHQGYVTPELRERKSQRNLKILAQANEQGDFDPYLAMEYGHALFQTSKYEEALEQYARIWQAELSDELEIKRHTPLFIANTFKELQQKEDAFDWYCLSADFYPDVYAGLYEAAKCYSESHDLEQAIVYLKKLIQSTESIGSIPQNYIGVYRNACGLLTILLYGTKKYSELNAMIQQWFDHSVSFKMSSARSLQFSDQLPKLTLEEIPIDPWVFVECLYQAQELALAEKLYLHLKLQVRNDFQAQIIKDIHQTSIEKPTMKPNEVNQNLGTIQKPLKGRGKKNTLSVCMIVKNEEKNIEAAIESFRPFADEIIVNDTGSTDQTVPILKSLGVTLIETTWEGDFSKARNVSLDKATSSWIIWMDADDRVPAEEVPHFIKLKTAPLDRCFGFQVVNTQGGLPIGTRFMQTRMFPNHPEIRFERKIHEQIIFSCARLGLHSIFTETLIWHTGYEDPEQKKAKAIRNLDLLKGEVGRAEDPIIAMQEGDSLAILERWEEAGAAYEEAYALPNCREHNNDVWKELPNSIGRCYQQSGHFEKALTWFVKGQEQGPEKVEPWFYQGETLMRLNRHQEARPFFQKALALERSFSGVSNQYDIMRIYSFKYLCEVELKDKHWAQAFEVAQEFQEKYPQVVESRIFQAKALLGLRDFSTSELKVIEAIDMNPTASLEAWQILLSALDMQGKDQEFIEYKTQMAQYFPDQAKTLQIGQLPTPTQSASRTQPDLSICMIVKNESSNVVECLESLKGLDAEMIVVDTGSTDDTCDLVKTQGAELYHFDWIQDFGAARNESLKPATGRWVLWMDADDRLPSSEISRIQQLIRGEANKAYGFLIKNTQDGGNTGSVFNQIRLFPNRSSLRFEGKVHEQILPSIQREGLGVEFLNLTIHHTGYINAEIMQDKQRRNLEILQNELQENPAVKTPVRFYSIAGAYFDLKDWASAIEWYRRSIVLAEETGQDPHVRSHSPVKIAECHANQGDYTTALDMVSKVLTQSPSNEEARLLEAQMLQKLQRQAEAMKSYVKLFVFQEGQSMLPVDYQRLHLTALKELAEFFKAQGRDTLAMELLKLALLLGKGQKFSSQKILSLLFDDEEYEYCLSLLQQEAHVTQDADHYLNMGKVCILLNQVPEALKNLKEGNLKFPHDDEIQNLLQALVADIK